jgi:hypothetical protein
MSSAFRDGRSRRESPVRSEHAFRRDFSTPQGAVLRLEDAYRQRDIDACVAAKDFAIEAELMLRRLLEGKNIPLDESLISAAASTLEMAYRAEFTDGRFPDMAGTESSFEDPEIVSDGILLVTEHVRYPDGTLSSQRLLVAETSSGWRVLNPSPNSEQPGL